MLDDGIKNAPNDLAALNNFHGLEASEMVIGGYGRQHLRNANATNMRSAETKKWSFFLCRRFPDHGRVERINERTEIGLLESRRHGPH